jgi:hypothetical protein
MVQVVKRLLYKWEALSLNSSSTKKKKGGVSIENYGQLLKARRE